jgi:hypothetical protein
MALGAIDASVGEVGREAVVDAWRLVLVELLVWRRERRTAGGAADEW